ncbi:MAG: TFIIB-type zinc ribbon-containing protein [Planctomycetota bacterium]
MKCPRCKSILKQGTVKTKVVEIDYCSQCKGFFMDKDEIEQVSEVAIRELSIPPNATQSRTLCPVCEEWMFVFDYPQTFVKIDICKKCKGLWLDPGELKEIDVVRRNFQKTGTIKQYDEVRGFKGWLIEFIDDAIEYLKHA